VLKDREHIDDLFAEGLYNYEEKAPAYLWNNIQSEIKQTKRIKRYSKIRAIAASVALLMTFGMGYLSSDYALRKKYEAKYLSGNHTTKISNERNNLSEDSVGYVTDDTVINPADENKKISDKIINAESVAENDLEDNRGILYRLFNLSKDIFFEGNESELNTNQLAQNNQSQEEDLPNQLLIDTLLLEKENLHEGGFLLTEKKKSKSNWSFGTKFSPVYSMAENSGSSSQLEQSESIKSSIKDERPDTKTTEKSLLAFSGGVNVNYHLSERWSLESGLFYSQRKQMAENLVGSAMAGYEDEMLVYTPEGGKFVQPAFNETRAPEVIGSSRDETYYSLNMDYISNFEYIELPILVRYKIVDRKLGLDVLSGVSTNFLIGNRTSITDEDSQLWSGETGNVSPLLYNATFGLGVNYNFYRNFSFNLEPTFKYSIVPSSTSSLARYPYSFAVFAGFSYRFK
jgi:hypothetical protein